MSHVVFPTWLYFGKLNSIGWPRKVGLRRKPVVDAKVADLLVSQVGNLGRSIGSTYPEVGLSLIADSFRRDWGEDQSEFADFLRDARDDGTWGDRFSSIATEVPWDDLTSPGIGVHITGWFFAETWYGICHPEEVEAAFNAELGGAKARAAEWATHGLDMDPAQIPESAAEQAEHAIGFVREWETEVGPLPDAPASLRRQSVVMRFKGTPRPTTPAAPTTSGPSSDPKTAEPELIGFSFGATGGKFHCVECIDAGTWKQNQRVIAVARFPTLQQAGGMTPSFARALHVVRYGALLSREYEVVDDSVPGALRDRAEITAIRCGLLLVPSKPIPIRSTHLTCVDCHRNFS